MPAKAQSLGVTLGYSLRKHRKRFCSSQTWLSSSSDVLPAATGLEGLHATASACTDLQAAVPLDRWDVDAWCACQMANCLPCTFSLRGPTFQHPAKQLAWSALDALQSQVQCGLL